MVAYIDDKLHQLFGPESDGPMGFPKRGLPLS